MPPSNNVRPPKDQSRAEDRAWVELQRVAGVIGHLDHPDEIALLRTRGVSGGNC
jgi:hypothetical protein